MYGLVNQAVEDLVRTRFGDAKWDAIKRRAGVDVPAFIGMEAYPDELTYSLVGAASEELGATPDALLEAFGEYWTLYTAQKGYGHLFALGGSTFLEFLQNLDGLHTHVGLSFPHLQPPSFLCTDIAPGSVRLHYRSTRDGLAPMVIGLLRGLGRMFQTDVTIAHVCRRSEGADHDEFLITHAPAP